MSHGKFDCQKLEFICHKIILFISVKFNERLLDDVRKGILNYFILVYCN